MIRTVLCVVLYLVWLPANTQPAVADSLRSLTGKINSIPAGRLSACKKIEDYKLALSKINPGTFSNTVAQFLFADSQFIKANKNGGCPVSAIVHNLDSLLYNVKKNPSPDSAGIIKALLYVKYEYAGFVHLGLAVTGKNGGVAHPSVTIYSNEPVVVPARSTGDSAPVDIYIRAGKQYLLTVAASGYNAYHTSLTVEKDSLLSIDLTNITTGGSEPVKPPLEKGGQSYWWVPALLLAALLGVLVWKILFRRRKAPDERAVPLNPDYALKEENARNTEGHAIQLNEQLKEKDALITNYTKEIERLQAHIDLKQTGSPEEKRSGAKPDKQPTTPYFLSEIMMTAGPRKKPMSEPDADKDLGEDVCGFIMAGNEVLVWLLDGTSDFYCLRDPETKREYFSSRLLAQSIAGKLKTHFAQTRGEAFDKIMAKILGEVKLSWKEVIQALPPAERNILKTNIRSGNIPQCAATVLLGRLSIRGELVAYRSGDSKMFVYNKKGESLSFLNTTLSSKNDKSNDRVFFRLILTDGDELDILYNEPIFEIVTLDNISTVIGFSDGIGKATEEELKNQYTVDADVMRSDIIYQLQGTEDDKSLYMIEIK